MWHVKQQSNKQNKNKLVDMDQQKVVTRGKGVGKDPNPLGKGGQTYGHRWKLDF